MNRPHLISLLLAGALAAGGCSASRPLGALALGGGGAALAGSLSDGDPALTAAGAAGGILLSEGAHYLARRESAKAYEAGYDKGRSDAAKEQYWLRVQLQRDQDPGVRLYPIALPERVENGVILAPSTQLLRLPE